MTSILDLIDGAIRDYETSNDAARYMPAEARTDLFPDSQGNALAAGVPVTYHGHRPADHGEWTFTGPCLCDKGCFAAYALGDPPRYVLSRPGDPRLLHVSPSSITVISAARGED